MKCVFGPVPSRRLGQSLGIDTVPFKTCNWNCVYCQLGRSAPLRSERREYVQPLQIAAEVEAALAARRPGEIDWVTFVASGETTLHAGLGGLIRRVKAMTDLPVAVITNGSLLYLPDVRDELAAADAVLPSLDAGDAVLYRKINRPHPACTYGRLVDGLCAFRQMYSGKLWVETMLVRGLNDDERALRDIAAVLERIRPDSVQINVPTRPPAEAWVEPPDREALAGAVAVLGRDAEVIPAPRGEFDLDENEDMGEAILGVITRHPMRREELERALAGSATRAGRSLGPAEVEGVLAQLEAAGRARRVRRFGSTFWVTSRGRYAESVHMRRPAGTVP